MQVPHCNCNLLQVIFGSHQHYASNAIDSAKLVLNLKHSFNASLESKQLSAE